MTGVLGDVLPAAIGVALSPMPIFAVLLLLLSERAHSNGPAFLAGWIAGLLAIGIVVFGVADAIQIGEGERNSALRSLLYVVSGVLLLFAALYEWRSHRAASEEIKLPTWLRAIDAVTPPKALGLGFLLSGFSPKNAILVIAGVAAIEGAGLAPAAATIVFALFVILGSVTIAIPVGYELAGGANAKARLDGWKAWLTMNSAAVMAVVLLMFGVSFLGKGLGGLGS